MNMDIFQEIKILLLEYHWEHIVEKHPELEDSYLQFIPEILENPDLVKRSVHDQKVLLFYKYYEKIYNGKYVCVVVKLHPDNNFIITAYITDRIKKGELIWKKNSCNFSLIKLVMFLMSL